ncbi:MAG: pilus assembly protein PilM [Candidatus Omnitrophota bacterium]
MNIKIPEFKSFFQLNTFSQFKLLKKSVVALDIGPQEIRVMTPHVTAAIPTPPQAVVEGNIIKTAEVAAEIQDLFQAKQIKNKDVAVAVGGRHVMLRVKDIPAMTTQGIKDFIKNEASKYLVFVGSKLVSDYHLIEERMEGGQKKLKILSVVAKKENIDSHIALVKSAGLNLQAIDVAALAVVRAIAEQEDLNSGVVVLGIVEYSTAVIFILNEGKIHYLHNIDSLSELNSELESIFGYCRNEFGQEVQIRKIVSTDFKDCTIAKGLSLRNKKEKDFISGINLIPTEVLREKAFHLETFRFVYLLAAVVIAIIFMALFLRFKTQQSLKEMNVIKKGLEETGSVLNRLFDKEQKAEKYQAELAMQNKIIKEAKRIEWAEVLEEIKRIIPKKVFLTKISENKKEEVEFAGEAIEPDAVFDFVKALSWSRYFKEVCLGETKDKETKEGMQAYFTIDCRLNTQGDDGDQGEETRSE